MRDKNAKNMLLAIVVALVLLGGTTGAVWMDRTEDKKAAQAKIAAASTATPAGSTGVKGEHTDSIRYRGQQGRTALALLKEVATVVAKDSQYGPYVDTINGVQGGQEGKYWAFYVNGTLSSIGADAYITQDGDSIEWKFE